jgi:Fe-S-cluster containining protein
MANQFHCNPNKYCKDATCCKSEETAPSLGVGDYIRLSEKTGEPLADIWRTKGDVHISTLHEIEGGFLVVLGLEHEPCPYLQETGCKVYDSRPLTCQMFPTGVLLNHKRQLSSNYHRYTCLKDTRATSDDINTYARLQKIVDEEVHLDMEHLWKGHKHIIIVPTIDMYFDFARDAIRIQSKKDPLSIDKRSRRVIEAVHEMRRLHDKTGGDVTMTADQYAKLLRPVTYSMIQDQVTLKLETLTETVRKEYRKTTERLKKVRS